MLFIVVIVIAVEISISLEIIVTWNLKNVPSCLQAVILNALFMNGKIKEEGNCCLGVCFF